MTDSNEPAGIQIISCGPSTAECTCECARGGPCTHQWDGEGVDVLYEDGGGMSSVSCSKCGMLAISHSMWVGP
jgi:hypothetical protein